MPASLMTVLHSCPCSMRQLFEALKSNDSVTSLNLTNCSINDDSAQVMGSEGDMESMRHHSSSFIHSFIHSSSQVIAAALGMSGAVALIELDLRDNPLSDVGVNALVRSCFPHR